MPLNPSGPISLGGTTAGQSIALEVSAPGTAQIALNDSNVRTLAGPAFATPGTTIVMPTDFYGKSSVFNFNVPAGTDVNLRTAAIAAGWPGSGAAKGTVQPGTTLQSSSTGGYALTINGAWPGGVTLDNRGLIVGRGGNGGYAGANAPAFPGQPGFAAGTAILVSVPVTINNPTGTIAGGGGGGGGGPGGSVRVNIAGGGGGGGIGGGTGGPSPGSNGGQPGQPGTTTSAGAGGNGGLPGTGVQGGPGGAGGGYGSAGVNSGVGFPGPRPISSGGAAGNSVSGNPLVSWPTGFGTIFGNRV